MATTTVETPQVRSSTGGRAMSRLLSVGFTWPRVFLLISAFVLGVATIFEFWSLTLHAPQYPDGLEVTIYTYKITGDVSEVDGLNHYIGMMPLDQAAEFERSIAAPAIMLIIVLGLVAAFYRRRWAPLLSIPIVLFPIVFAADLYFWLYRAGHDLDPTAALSSSIKPFTPAILGEGIVGQFSTTAYFGVGFYIAVIAAIMALAGIIGMLRQPSTGSPK
jgi:copper chaperone NosL